MTATNSPGEPSNAPAASRAGSESDDDNPVWDRLAGEIVERSLKHFIDGRTGGVREFFTEDWRPADGLAGRLIEPGHQFGWAWLLERWGRHRMAGLGLRHGIEKRRGVVMNPLLDDMWVHDASRGCGRKPNA